MLPFLVNMARLFELFVAEWLKLNLPSHLVAKVQEPVANVEVTALIDVVVNDAISGETRFVLDTKYKRADKPANEDIFQIVAYAKAKQCREAILIYPVALAKPLDTMWADIRVRSLTFDLSGDLDRAGRLFIEDLTG
jgi:5-methylcytosine-specific restriction enzyme subunit McrC